MPVWFLIVLLAVVAVAVLLDVLMARGRASGGQNTTIIERPASTEDQTATVVERD